MSYRKIAVDKKAEAVKRVFRGEMVTAVAADLGIDRNSLALWVRRVVEAIHSNLGRKKNPVREKAVPNIVAKLNRLREKIARQKKTIAEMRDSLKLSVEAPVPERCPVCGCVRFYKNGMSKVHLEHLLDMKVVGVNHVIPVQKFICVNCGNSMHLEGPSALFHWIAESYRHVDGGEICAGGEHSAGAGRN